MLFFRKKTKKATVYIDGKKHVINLNKTPEQREKENLEWQIKMANGDQAEIFTIKHKNELMDLQGKIYLSGNLESKDMTLEERYNAVMARMNCLDEMKNFCYSYGLGGLEYFEKVWSYAYNNTAKRFQELKEKMGK